ncbi:MAG: signal peptidase I [Ktedonobacteraceae bacterium]|nr:signal peptidase I [Ktedonobacteraceae bacterium]
MNFEKRYRLVREVIETIVLTLLMFLVINLAVQNFDVDGHSMEPNLHDKERLMVDKWTYQFHPPARGDVIVFVAPPQPSLDYVKRIIGLPGDVITIHNTTVIVDGVTLHDTFISPANQGNPFANKRIENLVVPPNNYFVLGDNRANSSDSRDWGFLPRKNIIGRAALVYWPLGEDNDGLLPNVSSVFAGIHQQASAPPTTQQASNSGILDASTVLFCIVPVVVVGVRRRRRRKHHDQALRR